MEYNKEELPVYIKWMEFLEWLLQRTEKFPKSVRFTFASRIDNLALDIIEDIMEAKYSKEKAGILKKTNLKLEKLRIFLRLSHNQKYINVKSYEYAVKKINEFGGTIGNWIKYKEKELA